MTLKKMIGETTHSDLRLRSVHITKLKRTVWWHILLCIRNSSLSQILPSTVITETTNDQNVWECLGTVSIAAKNSPDK